MKQAHLLLGLLLGLAVVGCTVTRELSTTPRTPLEQMLLDQSLERCLEDIVLPVLQGDSVLVRIAGITDDQRFAAHVVTTWLRRQGLVVSIAPPVEEDFRETALKAFLRREGIHIGQAPAGAAYLLHVTLRAFGTEQSNTFFGIPPIQSVLIPFSTPELTVYGSMRQRGYAQLALDLFDADGRLLASPRQEAVVTLKRYTVLFLFTYQTTDLIPPPL